MKAVLLVSLLAAFTNAMPKITTAKKLSNKRVATLTDIATVHQFVEYTSSQALCSDLYDPWWKDFLARRLKPPKIIRNDERRALVKELLLAIGLPRLYDGPGEVGPIHSVYAEYGYKKGSRSAHINAHPRECFTTCEDIRSAIEIWLTGSNIFQKEISLEVRDKTPFNMVCPEGMVARIELVTDRREPPDDSARDVIDMIRRIDSTFLGEQSYVSDNAESQTRVIGQPVSQCFCREMSIVLEQVQCADWDLDVAINSAKRARQDSDETTTLGSAALSQFDAWFEENSAMRG